MQGGVQRTLLWPPATTPREPTHATHAPHTHTQQKPTTTTNKSPLGAAALLATYDDAAGPSLHLLEPSGVAHRYYGAAVGKGRQAARNELERLKLGELSARDAVKEAARM